MNFSRKMKAGVAALAAIATLGAGGVVASTAFAGGGGGNQPGTGGNLAAVQFWQYKDDASGAWGPATSLDSVRAAMNNAGVTLEGDGVTKAQTALTRPARNARRASSGVTPARATATAEWSQSARCQPSSAATTSTTGPASFADRDRRLVRQLEQIRRTEHL